MIPIRSRAPAMLTRICMPLVAAGCTTVVIHTEGKVTTETRFGILKLSIDDARVHAVALSSFGISSVPGTVAFGWVRWRGVSVAPGSENSCLFVDFGSEGQGED